MEVKVGGKMLQFNNDPETEQLSTQFVLPEWSKFRSENSRKGLEGEHVLFILPPENIEEPDSVQEPAFYSRAIGWFLDNQKQIKEAALDALVGYIDVLRNEYGIDDDELNDFSSKNQLTQMVDLSFIYFYPRLKADKPVFGLELECNWDPESGCGILFNGASVVDIGSSDTAQSGGEI